MVEILKTNWFIYIQNMVWSKTEIEVTGLFGPLIRIMNRNQIQILRFALNPNSNLGPVILIGLRPWLIWIQALTRQISNRPHASTEEQMHWYSTNSQEEEG